MRVPSAKRQLTYNHFMKVHQLNCGSCSPACGRLFSKTSSCFARGSLSFHCLLIETDAGLVLVDTGLGAAELQRLAQKRAIFIRLLFKPATQIALTAREQIVALGFDPADVRHIIMTHMDYDHAGGLVDFPDAKVHLARAEHVSMTRRRSLLELLRYDPRQIAHHPRFVMHEPAGVRWKGLTELRASTPENSLPAGIKLLSMPGHSRGHCGVAIKLSSDISTVNSHDKVDWLLHAGDALIHHGELANQPYCPLGHRMMRMLTRANRREWKATLTALRMIARQGKVKLINTHDPAMVID